MLNKRVRVGTLKARGKRATVYLKWRDPVTGKERTQSSGTRSIVEARDIARDLERRIQQGTYRAGNTPWLEFVEQYRADHVDRKLRPGTAATVCATLRRIEELIDPATLEAFATHETIRRFRRLLAKTTTPRVDADEPGRKAKPVPISEATVARHMRQVRAMLRWAKREGMLDFVPSFEVEATPAARARAVTTEEFERMLDAVERVRGLEGARGEPYRFLLSGLWLTGLRLSEALRLRWEDGLVSLVWNDGRPRLVFDAKGQKNGKSQAVPLAQEAIDLFGSVPVDQRAGLVFQGLGRSPDVPADRSHVGRTIKTIGQRAGVFTGPGKAASAHDLRRGFGARWAMRVVPGVLTELMRHRSPATTQRFYSSGATDAVEEALRRAERAVEEARIR